MTDVSAETAAVLLSKGFCEIYDRIVGDGAAVRQDATLPPSARLALARLSRIALADGAENDFGASIHEAMDRACSPFKDWGLPSFAPPFKHADVCLIDLDLGVPTDDCRELARSTGSEAAILEEIQHERLRAALKGYAAKEQSRAYADIREFVVRNPVVPYGDILRFIGDGGHLAAARTITQFYRDIPLAALHGGVARRCANCGSLLWPDRDAASFPEGRCRLSQCRLSHPHPAKRDDIAKPAEWKLADPGVLAYWIGPGLDEIRIHDALKAAGRKVALYPQADAADVGVDGLAVGVDVKTYASPVLLAAKLSRSIGRLDMFARKIVAVPDAKLTVNQRYLEQLHAAYTGKHVLEFMTVSQAIGMLSR